MRGKIKSARRTLFLFLIALLIGVAATLVWYWRAQINDFLSHLFLYYQD